MPTSSKELTVQDGHNAFIAHRKHAQLEYLADLNNMLAFANSKTSKAYYTDAGLDDLKLYLDAGASANIVLYAAIRFKHLASVKLAFNYTITQNFINTALEHSTLEIIQLVVCKQNQFHFDKKSVEFCFYQKINILNLFNLPFTILCQKESMPELKITTRFAELTPLQKAQLIVYCLSCHCTESAVSPFVMSCLPGAELNNSTEADSQPLHAAMKGGYYKIVKILLRAGASPATTEPTNGTMPIKAASSPAIMYEFLREIRKILEHRKRSNLSHHALKNLKNDYHYQLNLALSLSAAGKSSHLHVKKYLELGAELTTATLEHIMDSYDFSEDFLKPFIESHEKLELTPGMVSSAIYRSKKIDDLFSPLISNTNAEILSQIVRVCFNYFIPSDNPAEERNQYHNTQLIPFMRKCFSHGADINTLHDASSTIPWVLAARRINTPINGTTPHTITFLHAAVLFRNAELMRMLLESGADTTITIKLAIYTNSLNSTLLHEGNFTAIMLAKKDCKSVYFKTIASLKILHTARVALFIFLNSHKQKHTALKKLGNNTYSVLMNLAKYLLPDDNQRAQCILQYERIFSNNRNRLFFKKEDNAVSEPPTTLVLRKST